MIHRICTLTENGNGYPLMSQFTLGDADKGTVEAGGFYIGYGGTLRRGYRARYLLWKHSPNLYLVFCARGPNNIRRDFLEESPRNGLRGYPYCEQVGSDWRVYRCSGLDMSLPPGERAFYSVVHIFTQQQQPPPPSTVTQGTPWEIGDYRIMELVPAIPCNLAGFDLPEYPSAQEDDDNGDEI